MGVGRVSKIAVCIEQGAGGAIAAGETVSTLRRERRRRRLPLAPSGGVGGSTGLREASQSAKPEETGGAELDKALLVLGVNSEAAALSMET